ncbi:hypothetical protein ABZ923_14145 [Streptomyces sp. NPDC046881]|uniref:hypothetical protein n=1 Tax=Streptomyces sp. NPDC046881 TaxID=3155374 RepID=UPI0033CFF46E
MRLTFDDGWRATVTDAPLSIAPRFTGTSVAVVDYADVKEREQFLLATFGSRDWLWDAPDVLRFDSGSRALVGVEFPMPYVSQYAGTYGRLPVLPPVRPGGLRADEVRDFRHEMCAVLCRVPGDAVLTGLRDLDVLDEPLEARIGIAPDVALLVQHGAVVGWTLTDPARRLTTAYAAPDPAPPSPATRRLLSACLDLVTDPLLDEVQDHEPAALARLREVHEALRAQREDRHRVDVLLSLIGNLVEDYGNR